MLVQLLAKITRNLARNKRISNKFMPNATKEDEFV